MWRDIAALLVESLRGIRNEKKPRPCSDLHSGAAMTQPHRPTIGRWF